METIFIIYLQRSWSSNLTLRITKSPKVYLEDTGLLSYLLDLSVEAIEKNNVHVGKILENFVVNEIKKQATWSNAQPELYHFRATSGEEVDLILENRSGKIIGIEIKNSAKVLPENFKGLKYLKERAKNKFLKGIALYTGNQYIPFGEDLFAMPVNSLWEDLY